LIELLDAIFVVDVVETGLIWAGEIEAEEIQYWWIHYSRWTLYLMD